MKSSILTFFLSLHLTTTLAHGATINVGAGESIQTAVDTASSGDTIVLPAPADYDGNVTIVGKALRIVSLHRNNHDITGSITISAIPTGQSVTFKNLSVSGSVSTTDSSLNLLRCTMGQEVNATNPGNANTQLSVVQSVLSGKLNSTLTRTWVGYSDLRQSYFEGQVEIVGNIFDGNGFGGIGIDLNGSSTVANVHNNQVKNFSGSYPSSVKEVCIGIRIDSMASANIKNNHIEHNKNHTHRANSHSGMGVFVKSTQSTLISSNTLRENFVGKGNPESKTGNSQIWAPPQNVKIMYNAIHNHSDNISPVRGGAYDLYSISDISINGHYFLTQPSHWMSGKAGQDAGSPKEIDNDHDGTRNDIGPNGGRNYIPNGRTTDKPIPISFTIAPQIVPIGGTVTIESTGATLK
ncbi:MAG: hypothetical protein ACJZ64_01930 [Opitutales bacterium]